MIKKLQALKAKKGFTLVELVVVIAIIGVLAAILVPTMIGVVQDSNITSSDSTANQIKTQTTTFLTKMDTAKLGLKNNTATGEIIKFKVNNGKWTLNCTPSSKFGDDTKATWGTAASITDLNRNYCLFMADVLRDLKDATVEICVASQACVGVAVIEGDGSGTSIGITKGHWDAGNTPVFTGNKPGLKDDGTIIGTNPKLDKGTGS